MEPVRDERANANGHHCVDEPSSHHRDVTYAHHGAGTTSARRRKHRRKHHTKQPKVDEANVEFEIAPGPDGDARKQMGPGERVQFLLDKDPDDMDDNGLECHPLFTEMEELQGTGEAQQWREVARWVKFEEDVEEGGDRWSKPHVATLSLHSLFELRSCILNGSVILDLEADSFSGIIDIMLDKLVASKNLEFMLREEVKDCLMLRKRHQYEGARPQGGVSSHGSFMNTVRSIADIGKTFSHGKNLHHHSDEHKEGSPPKTKQSGPNLALPKVSSIPRDVGDLRPQESRLVKLAHSLTGGRASSLKEKQTAAEQTPPPKSHLPPEKQHVAFTLGRCDTPPNATLPKKVDSASDLYRAAHGHHGKTSVDQQAQAPPSTNPPDKKTFQVGNSASHNTLHSIGVDQKPSASNASLLDGVVNKDKDKHGGHHDSILHHLLHHHDKGHGTQGNLHFFKKLPAGCEASNVLVGEVDFLSHHMAAFIRLKEPLVLAELTEVPVPTRFVFVLLGPAGHGSQYREVGRAIATLMSDEVFHDVAYKARNCSDILDGVDEFLDQVTVLPPGEWDPNIRIEPPSHIPSQDKRKTKQEPPKKSLPLSEGGAPGDDGEGPTAVEVLAGEEDEHTDPTLKRTGRLFGGLIQDIKRKVPWYLTDFRDGINTQCFAAFCFMYFALLAPIVTFGGLLEEATGQRMAAMENLLAGAVCGITYHIFSGQPLTIIGSTGPVLVFETIVFDTCRRFDIGYLTLRFWINCWMALILFIVVATDGSAAVSYITRFTEESFATLIAVIFIVEALKKLIYIYKESVQIEYMYPPTPNSTCACVSGVDGNDTLIFESVNPEWFNKVMAKQKWNMSFLTEQEWFIDPSTTAKAGGLNYSAAPLEMCKHLRGNYDGDACYPLYDVVLMSTVLMFGTFILSMGLKKARNSPYFPSRVRQVVSDFAVMIAIIIMVAVDWFFRVDTPKLNVPSEFKPTWEGRGWIVDPFANELWTIPAAIVPALFGSILIFMDQQITAVIVNRKENKFKKGAGYHLDLLVITIQLFVVGLLGIPIYVAATVLAINHVNALKMESEACAPGEVPGFIGVREQRFTGVLTFIFIGMSVLLTGVLAYIPMPVLYGVFLYMGISALGGIQLFDRILLLIMPMKYQPDFMYLRHVPIKRVHLYTMFQVACLALLWIIKSIKSTSIFFPIMLVVMVGVRKAMEYVFSEQELAHLDQKMPELHLRKKADAEKKKIQADLDAKEKRSDDEEEEDDMGGLSMKPIKTQGHLHIPMASGNVMKIPLTSVAEAAEHDERPINISEEVNRSGLWKHIESQSSLGDYKRAHGGSDPPASRVPAPTSTLSGNGPREPDDEGGIMINLQRPSPGPSVENVHQQGSKEKQPLLAKGKEGSPV